MTAEPGRLAETLAAVSAVGDLARGHGPDEAMRASILATALARSTGISGPELADVHHVTLLRFCGCTATSHEYAALLGGDDVAVRRRGDMIDAADPRELLAFLAGLGGPGLAVRTLLRGRSVPREAARADCEVGAAMARRFGLPDAVSAGIQDGFERWDGRGVPAGKSGEEIALPARVAAVAYAGVMFGDAGGPETAAAVARKWAGRALDPALAMAFAADAGELLRLAAPDDPWAATVDCEPEPRRTAPPERIEEIAAAVGAAVDLKSPWFHGHSARVAASVAACSPDSSLRLAATLQDIGRAGVPAGVLEKPCPLTHGEREAVRLHAYHSERILARAPAFALAAAAAGAHHERMDGSGYHRGTAAAGLDAGARLLAAADVLTALTSARPHRPASTLEAAAVTMAAMPLDRDAVDAVLTAAGTAPPRRPRTWPAGLTDREVQVTRLLAAGRTKRQVAAVLHISPSTAHTHTVHVYEKCAVSTRAGLALFAMQHGLLEID